MAEPVLNQVCSYCNISRTMDFFCKRDGKKCKNCKNKKLSDKPSKVLSDDWKNHKDYPDFYFERNTNNIYNKETNNYIKNIRTFSNKTSKNAKDIKWEIFNGDIPKNKIIKTKNVDSIILDDLECVYVHCDKCNKLIENPEPLSKYCSKRCQLNSKNKQASNGRS